MDRSPPFDQPIDPSVLEYVVTFMEMCDAGEEAARSLGKFGRAARAYGRAYVRAGIAGWKAWLRRG